MKISELVQNGRGSSLKRERLREFLERVNDTHSSYPRHATVSRVFDERASKDPEAIAILFGDQKVKYGELAKQASALSGRLERAELPIEGAVGLLSRPSPDVVASMLGILAAGGAYLPLLPDWPVERLMQQLRECHATILITEGVCHGLALQLKELCPEVRHVLVAMADVAKERCHDRSRAGGLAYIMYTSGTEGAPKAVAVEHRSILRLVLNTNWVSLSCADRILLTGSLAFDACTFEIWGALLNGGTLVIPDRDQLLNPFEIGSLIRTHAVTTMWLTAGLFNALASSHLEIFSALRTVISGGERVSPHHFQLVQRAYPSIRLKNGYGPTENTTFTTVHDFTGAPDEDVPIGKPISNTTVYILDKAMKPVDIGVIGELCTGGDGLARGYLNDPVLTAERFIIHPDFGRLYRTGDLAMWQPEGFIRFIGRADNQLKIRGHRVEPGEIEARILRYPGVRECAVIAASSPQNEKRLIAFFTAGEVISATDLRAFVRAALPDWMVPFSMHQLAELPLTPNGKVDRSALPVPTECAYRESSQRPESYTERELIAIWKEVLQLDSIAVDDDFFALGGHSQMAVSLIWLIHERLSSELPFSAILNSPTIRDMARLIIERSRFGRAEIDEAVLALTPEHTGPAIFAFPPGTADALSYAGLARLLTGNRLYGFNFFAGGNVLENWADRILDIEPDGPITLFGYSGGGNLAFRTAVVLEARGKPVDVVIMMDSSRFLRPYRFPTEESRRLASDFLNAAEVRRYASSKVLEDKVMSTIESYYDCLSSAVEDRSINAPIRLICAADSADEFRDEHGNLICSKSSWADVTRDSFAAWQGLGEHGKMLIAPALSENVQILRRIMKAFATETQPAQRVRT